MIAMTPSRFHKLILLIVCSTALARPRQTAPPNDNFANAIVISNNTFSDSEDTTAATVEANDPAFQPSCTDSTGPYNTVWYTFTPAVSGTLIADTFNSGYDTVLAAYLEPNHQPVMGGCNDDYNYPSVLTSQIIFTVNAGQEYSLMVSSYSPGGGALQFHATFYTPPSNDNFANATAFSRLPFTDTGNNFAATTEPTDPVPSCGASLAPTYTIWYSYTPAVNETVTADTIGSSYDTILSAYTGTAPQGFTEVACDDDVSAGILQSRVTFAAAGGTTYSFMISSFSSLDTGTYAFNVAQPGLTLLKTVTNNNGGTAGATAWTLTAKGASITPTNLSGTTPVTSGDGFSPDTYALAEAGRIGYTAGAWNCGTAQMPDPTHVEVLPGTTVACTINNDDTPPVLTLIDTVTNDNGGTAAPTAWMLTAVGTGGSPTNLSGTTGVTSAATFKADTYTLGESGPPNYVPGLYSCAKNNGVPVSSNTITLSVGDTAVCTINNNDVPPSLTLIKTVINDNGGTAPPSAWTLTATGSAHPSTNLSGTTPVVSGANFIADTYTLGEINGPAGYTAATYSCVKNSGAAVSSNTIALSAGDTATCTINDNDIPPTLTLIKTLTIVNGGTATASQWTLTATGATSNPTNISGTTPVVGGTNFKADTYTLSESGGPPGYRSSGWNCGAAAMPDGIHVVVPVGSNIICTVNNTDRKTRAGQLISQ